MTRMFRIHPYPGMIADELAMRITREYLASKGSLLDPFCGTGRTIVAAGQQGASAVGIDVNPLAVLVTLAKTATPNRGILHRLRSNLLNDIGDLPGSEFALEEARNVMWFSQKAKRQLSALISYINHLYLSDENLALVATVLSATVRDVSFCRKDQWKLHRMPPDERSCFRPCAWKIFLKRLDYVLSEIDKGPEIKGTCEVLLGDARRIDEMLGSETFDLLFTSPPYGDSQTTVQYGGISSLCLGVIQHLARLPIQIPKPLKIDTDCLGGDYSRQNLLENLPFKLEKYWRGEDVSNARERTASFLDDLFASCQQFGPRIKRNGHAVFVVARRTVGSEHLHLDKFVRDTMEDCGFKLTLCQKRVIAGKMTPYKVHKFGHSANPKKSKAHVTTMREEYVLVLKKLQRRTSIRIPN
jgi:site-specific DNA-methyltransferase (cytosine-N4-specific)